MKKSKKYLLAVLIELIIITVFNFGYGMIIGGEPNFIYYIFAIILSAISLVALFKFEFNKSDIIFTICVLTISVILFNFSYCFLNEIFADEKSTIEYDTEVVDYEYRGRTSFIDVYFKNSNNSLTKYSTDINGTDLSDEEIEKILGSEITVKETNGLFNYVIYEIEYEY